MVSGEIGAVSPPPLPRVHTFTFRRPLQRALQRQPASSSTFPLVTDNTCTVTSASHHRTHRATCSCTRNRNAKLHCAGGSPVSHLPASHLRLFALSLAIIFSIALPPRFSLGEFNQCSGLQSYPGFNSIKASILSRAWIPGLITHKLPLHCFPILSTNQLRTPKCVISLLFSKLCVGSTQAGENFDQIASTVQNVYQSFGIGKNGL